MIVKLVCGDFVKYLSHVVDLEFGSMLERPIGRQIAEDQTFGCCDAGSHPIRVWRGGGNVEEVRIGDDVDAYLCDDEGTTIERLWRARTPVVVSQSRP